VERYCHCLGLSLGGEIVVRNKQWHGSSMPLLEEHLEENMTSLLWQCCQLASLSHTLLHHSLAAVLCYLFFWLPCYLPGEADAGCCCRGEMFLGAWRNAECLWRLRQKKKAELAPRAK